VKELGDDSAVQAVEAVITHAREEASQRVAELRRQLEEAQSMLAALDGENP
jgi:Tfp pilus assembly protein FimV